ncbi:MAG TPA: integrin alpha, partial [Myxococcota bacterium]
MKPPLALNSGGRAPARRTRALFTFTAALLIASVTNGAQDPPSGAPVDWLAGVQQAIGAQEYRASESSGRLQAPNRAHNLRTYFEPSGIRVVDRTAQGSPELLTLQLRGLGRGARLAPAPAGELASEGARVEIRRPDFVEWYENTPAGLEHGVTLSKRPEGEGPLRLELSVSGARATSIGGQVVFLTSTGRRLAYGKLLAIDAEGSPVAASFEVPDGERVQIVLADASAVYPVIVDPLLTATADAQLESNQAGAALGIAATGAGDVNADGYADVIVGASGYDAGQTDEGAAFVFLGSATGVVGSDPGTGHAQLQSNQASAWFGTSVSSAGDVNGDGYADVIVGAYGYDAGQTEEGAAFVFLGGPDGIADGNPGTAHAQIESNQSFAVLGTSVSGAGDVNGDGYADIIVGAHQYDAGLNPEDSNEGAAFVFLGSAAGIVGSNPATAHAQIEANQASAWLGIAVSGAGDVNGDGYADVVVGAERFDSTEVDEGAAFVFLGSAAGIVGSNPATAHAQIESNKADARLGNDVSDAGDVNGDGYADIVVGAYLYDAGVTNEGAAFVFLGSAAGIVGSGPDTAHAQLESNQDSALLGSAVASVGDVNGDGYADVIAGAPYYEAGQPFEGAAFVYLGSASGIADGDPTTAHAQIEPDQSGAELGVSVASAGDVNGDGFEDIIVGAHRYDAGEVDEGAAFVFLGGPGASPVTADTQLESDQVEAYLGISV